MEDALFEKGKHSNTSKVGKLANSETHEVFCISHCAIEFESQTWHQ
jgi:hypothetical protein